MDHQPLRLAAIVGVALIAVAANAPAAAQNLVANSRFDTDIAGWAPVFGSGTAEWSPVDAASAPTSGSLRATATSPGPAAGIDYGTCVAVQGGTEYLLAADALVPAGQSRNGTITMGVGYHTNADCTGPSAGDIVGIAMVPGSWAHLARLTTAPGSARSATVLALVHKNEAGGTFVAHVDNVFLGGPPVTVIPSLSTVGIGLLVALLAGAAAILLRRTG